MDGDVIGMAAAASRPLTPGDMAFSLNAGPAASPGGLGSLTGAADAETKIVSAIVDHQLVLPTRAAGAAAFLFTHGCGDIAAFCLEMRKYQQRPRLLVKALDAISLKQFMRGLEVNLSNGK